MPGWMRARSASSPCPVTELTTWTGTPSATASTSATIGHGSSSRSDFVSTISGAAPLSQIVHEIALDPARLELRARAS